MIKKPKKYKIAAPEESKKTPTEVEAEENRLRKMTDASGWYQIPPEKPIELKEKKPWWNIDRPHIKTMSTRFIDRITKGLLLKDPRRNRKQKNDS